MEPNHSNLPHFDFSLDQSAHKWRQRLLKFNFIERELNAPHFIEIVSQALAAIGLKHRKQKGTDPSEQQDQLNQTGLLGLENLVGQKELDEIKSYFLSKPCFNSSVYIQSDGTPRPFKQASNEYAFGSYKFADVVQAPDLLEIANSPRVLEIVEHYLGCVPTLYSMNAWWSFPNNIRGFAPTERFHRDTDDYKFVTLFIYLTNVEKGSGPYQFVKGSHKASMLLEKLSKSCLDGPPPTLFLNHLEPYEEILKEFLKGIYNDFNGVVPAIFEPYIETVNGNAGYGFLADISSLHRALAPTKKPRLIFYARYGLFPNAITINDRIKPALVVNWRDRIKDDLRTRYLNRLVIDTSGKQVFKDSEKMIIDPVVFKEGDVDPHLPLQPTGINGCSRSITKVPHIIFCSGMTRSASRWSYETCETLEMLRTPETRIDSGYLGETDGIVDACVSQAMKASYDALVYNSHSFGKRTLRMILCGIAKNVYTYRDPRDSIASIMRISGREYESAFQFVHSSLLLFDLFSADEHSLLLPFSETLNDPIGTTAKIATYLDFNLTKKQIVGVHFKTQKLSIDRRNEQRRKIAYTSSDIKIIDRGLDTLHGGPTDVPKVDNPWRYSALEINQFSDATKRLRKWLIKMGFSTSPIPPWGIIKN